MLKDEQNNLTPKVISTLTYLQSLVSDEQVIISLTKDSITIVTDDEELMKPLKVQPAKANPIEDMMFHISDEVCTDCIMQDWQFKNPFFVDLIEAYVCMLVHTYGLSVPIPFELARAIIKWDLSTYSIEAKKGEYKQIVSKEAEIENLSAVKGWSYYLVV